TSDRHHLSLYHCCLDHAEAATPARCAGTRARRPSARRAPRESVSSLASFDHDGLASWQRQNWYALLRSELVHYALLLFVSHPGVVVQNDDRPRDDLPPEQLDRTPPRTANL